MSRMLKLIPLLDRLDNTLTGTTLNIVELGTIRNAASEYSTGDGWSTLHIAKWLRGKPHNFYSVDLKIDVARELLLERGLLAYVKLHESHSHTWLEHDCPRPVHFALLDTANDAQNTWREWQLIAPKLHPEAIVVVDDVNLESSELKKGDILIPKLQANPNWHVELTNRLAIITSSRKA